MKFLCPSCKAKYQIADEKVAGRSVRMKCRKCGFMIQVSSAMAAPPTDSDPPEPEATEHYGATEALLPTLEQAVKAAAEINPSPAAPLSARVATVTGTAAPGPSAPRAPAPKAPLVPAPRPQPAKPSPGVPKPATPPPRATAPRAPAAPAAAAPSPAAPPAVAKSSPLAAAPAAKSSPFAAPRAAAAAPAPRAAEPAPSPAAPPVAPAAAADLPRDFEAEDEVTRMADVGTLTGAGTFAGAFTQAFSTPPNAPTPSEAPLSMPGDEWFVGINGVPVGPIRLSELRSKAASGAVTKESLVWRDGFEDWRPLKTYPELLAIVEEGVSSVRGSLTPFMPLTADGAGLAAKPAVAADPFAQALSPGAVTGSAVVTDEIAGLIPPRRGTSPMVWVAMVIAIGLGLTLGFVLFGGQKPGETKIVEKIVEKEVPAKGNEPAAANNAPGETLAADPHAPKKATPKTAATASAVATSDSKPLPGLTGLSGLSNLGPTSGPNLGGPSGATAGNGAQLDGSQIGSTVARYTGSVKRRCWQPALDARAKDAPTSAKVTVTITVGPSGSVQNATIGGEPKGYPGLGSCIASSVRSWTFPASGGTTIANVPFVFAAQ